MSDKTRPSALTMDRRQFVSRPIVAGAVMALTPPLTGCIASPQTPTRSGGSVFRLDRSPAGLSGLRHPDDPFETDYIAEGAELGHVRIAYRKGRQAWRFADTREARASQNAAKDGDQTGPAATYTLPDGLVIESRIEPDGEALVWTVRLRNTSAHAIEVGDLELPLPMPTSAGRSEEAPLNVLKHSFVSGDGSFIYWMRSNSIGPYLMMVTERGTSLEYWRAHVAESEDGAGDGRPYSVFVHSRVAGEEARARGCNWRQPHTGLRIAPAGEAGAVCEYALRFLWAPDQPGVRDRLYECGGLDVHVVPGMTVPSDLSARIAVRSQDRIDSVTAEYPGQTRIAPSGRSGDWSFYDVTFTRLGENLLTLRHGGSRETRLEFFVTEPVETLIRKRAAFIAAHQIRDPEKWYDGLFAEWNMDTGVELSPDNYDRIEGWRIYAVTCDDPGLSKPAFLAAKNVEFPEPSEIEALDYYIERFVWGGLQRTREESYSYGIYGIPDWKTNREADGVGDWPRTHGWKHIWRPYDYPHIFMMYHAMYRIARDYPGMGTRRDARTYLDRAARTAIAMFTIPLQVIDWSAYGTGFYNELVIPDIIAALEAEGMEREAETLRGHWHRKVRYFVKARPDLFISEYSFDSTGFESTYALAHYALENARACGVSEVEARDFLQAQLAGNLFCRGTIEPAYYYLGSDYRGGGGDAYTLTYMSQMGGWAIQEYALHEAPRGDVHAHLRLGAASSLSAWALVNSGTAESDYGYWYSGAANDGGAGGGFEPAAFGETWLDQPHHRGSWYYSCEIDLGFCGGLRAAATILADDPVFGRVCHGGTWRASAGGVEIEPRDGVRRRIYLRLHDRDMDVEVAAARFTVAPVFFADTGREIRFALENDGAQVRDARLTIRGLPVGRYRIEGGREPVRVEVGASGRVEAELPLDNREVAHFALRRTG